jgi:aspartate aminotransferase/aminotransferase
MKALAATPSTMPGSGIREIVNLAVHMPDVIRLEVGEPNFSTPAHIIDAAHKAARDGFTKYTQSSGMLAFRELLARDIGGRHDYHVTADRINVSVGGVEAVTAVMIALIEAGDEVLVPDPGWPNYEMSVRIREARAVRYPLAIENGFLPRIEDLERLVTLRTKLLVLNSPSNPTGAVFPRALLEELVRFAQRHDLYVLSDEVYEHIIFEGEHFSPARLDPDRIMALYSFSKTYAMTGWRVGWVVANDEISKVIMKIQEPMISCVSQVAQKAAEAALTGPQDCVREMRDAYRERRDAVIEVLKSHGAYTYTPRGAFYIMVDIGRSGRDSHAFALGLLREKGVAVAPGTAFGDAGRQLVRVSLATERGALVEGVTRLCQHIDASGSRAN